MDYATVMVGLALGQSNAARLHVATALADRFEATLLGVAAACFAPPPPLAEAPEAARLIEQGEASLRDRLAGLEAEFHAATRGRDGRAQWRVGADYPARFMLRQARCADIIVTGGPSPAVSDAFSLASPQDLACHAGRPLLIVPDGIDWLDLRSALIAWKDTAEARRAIADALPMLRKARQITIVAVPEAGDDEHALRTEIADVVAWLGRHGLLAEGRVSRPSDSESIVGHLEDLASDLTAGLIIAGGYGHSRFREMILGGVTRHLISQTSRCVLLSH